MSPSVTARPEIEAASRRGVDAALQQGEEQRLLEHRFFLQQVGAVVGRRSRACTTFIDPNPVMLSGSLC